MGPAQSRFHVSGKFASPATLRSAVTALFLGGTLPSGRRIWTSHGVAKLLITPCWFNDTKNAWYVGVRVRRLGAEHALFLFVKQNWEKNMGGNYRALAVGLSLAWVVSQPQALYAQESSAQESYAQELSDVAAMASEAALAGNNAWMLTSCALVLS